MCPDSTKDDVQKIHDALREYDEKLQRISGFFKGPEVQEAQQYLKEAARLLKQVVNPMAGVSAESSIVKEESGNPMPRRNSHG